MSWLRSLEIHGFCAESRGIRPRVRNEELHSPPANAELAESGGRRPVDLLDLGPMIHKFTADARGKALRPVAHLDSLPRWRKAESSIL